MTDSSYSEKAQGATFQDPALRRQLTVALIAAIVGGVIGTSSSIITSLIQVQQNRQTAMRQRRLDEIRLYSAACQEFFAANRGVSDFLIERRNLSTSEDFTTASPQGQYIQRRLDQARATYDNETSLVQVLFDVRPPVFWQPVLKAPNVPDVTLASGPAQQVVYDGRLLRTGLQMYRTYCQDRVTFLVKRLDQ